jgi:hypothetical protein
MVEISKRIYMQEDKVTFLKTPDQNITFDIGEIVDIETGRMKLPTAGSLMSLDGAPLKRLAGLTLKEAMIEAAKWWEKTARYAMPDQRKTKGLDGQDYLSEYGVASGLLLGYPWENLTKEERLKVLWAWWQNVGVPRFIGGLGTSQIDSKKEIMQ